VEGITFLSAKMVRALGRSVVTMFLFKVSISGVAINPVIATDPLREDVYPGATFLQKGINGMVRVRTDKSLLLPIPHKRCRR
jgi:hypothetical protein